VVLYSQYIEEKKTGVFIMPTISMFYGIIIRMYFAPKEHNPPHIHAYYNEYKISFNIQTMEFMD
jgi:hypothetical protein